MSVFYLLKTPQMVSCQGEFSDAIVGHSMRFILFHSTLQRLSPVKEGAQLLH